jgi:hypothetical protein
MAAVLRLDAARLDARLQLGIAHARLGRSERARAEWMEYLKAAEKDPRHARGVEFVKSCLERLGRGT